MNVNPWLTSPLVLIFLGDCLMVCLAFIFTTTIKVIGHNNNNTSAGWHVNYVRLEKSELLIIRWFWTCQKVKFVINSWYRLPAIWHKILFRFHHAAGLQMLQCQSVAWHQEYFSNKHYINQIIFPYLNKHSVICLIEWKRLKI